MGDQVYQAPGVRTGVHGAVNHIDNAAADVLQVSEGFGCLNLLGKVERATGLQAEQVSRINDADQLLVLIDDRKPVNIVFCHFENGFEYICRMSDSDDAGMHDVADLVSREVRSVFRHDVAQVPYRKDADRGVVVDDNQAGNVLVTHQSCCFNHADIGRTGDRWTAADIVYMQEEKTLFVKIAAGHNGSLEIG